MSIWLERTDCLGSLTRPATDPQRAAEARQDWINLLEPDIVVTEKLSRHEGRKGQLTRDVIEACAVVASYNYLHDISVRRNHG